MAKYSTGGVGGDAGGACELCGAEGSDLSTETVAGARLQVCPDCARHGESEGAGGDGGTDRETDRKRQAAQNTARIYDASKGDATHWEEGADYEDDPLPYLVRGYDERLREARQVAGLQPDELAEELDLEEDDILAVEQGRAARAGVGGSVLRALEAHLEVQLVEED